MYAKEEDKKLNEYFKLGMPRPMATMSRRPGLGDQYYKQHKEEIWERGYIQLSQGNRARIPKYYIKMMEQEDPERLWKLQCRRREKSIDTIKDKMSHTDVDYATYLKNKQRSIEKIKISKKGTI